MSRKVILCLGGELTDASAPGKHFLSALQTWDDAAQDIRHAKVRCLTRVQLILDTEQKKCQIVEHTIVDLQ